MTRTDNDNVESKQALRSYFLERYHADGARVFDACQGSGDLWRRLRSKHTVTSYWGVDIKRARGRLRASSVSILAAGPIDADVIDIDTCGSPWQHWGALLSRLPAWPCSVFLTFGRRSAGGPSNMAREAQRALGLDQLRRPVPKTLLGSVSRLEPTYAVAAAAKLCTVVEAVMSPDGRRARYLGVHLAP
jgi:hypothetical protein